MKIISKKSYNKTVADELRELFGLPEDVHVELTRHDVGSLFHYYEDKLKDSSKPMLMCLYAGDLKSGQVGNVHITIVPSEEELKKDWKDLDKNKPLAARN